MSLPEEDNVLDFAADSLPKLTDWENEPTVANLKQDYEDARTDHSDHTSNVDRWLDNLRVTGSAKVSKVKGRSTIVPKLIRKQAEWRYPSLSEPFLAEEDIFKTSPRTHLDKEAAYQNGLILNYQFNTQIDKETFIGDYVRTAVDEGTVVVRIGWDFEEEEQEVEVPVFDTRPISDPAQVMQMLEQGQEPVEQVQTGTETEMQMVTVRNEPTVEVCPYNNIVVDPTCQGNIKKANFIIFSFETSLSDLKKDSKYENLDHIDVEGNSILSEPDHESYGPQTFNFKDKPRQKFVAYEYWGFWDIDGTGTTRPFVATWVGDVMIRMEESPFPDSELPFVIIPYLPVRFSIYGEPDGELLEDNQKVLGAVTRGVIDSMGRSAAGQKGTRSDALDVTNRRKFEMGEDYEFQAHVDPRQAFYDHQFPEIPQSAQFMLQSQQMEAESLTGVKAFHEGLSSDSFGQVAAGIKGALSASGKREMDILRRLAKGLKDIAYKIMSMNGEFLSDEEIIPITDEEFVTINRENLRGRYDVKLNISSSEMDNIKAQELAFMLQTMGNSLDPAMSQIILADIARLRKMPELAKQIQQYQPQPDPMKQQLQQLEMQKLQAEVAKLQSEANENKANAILDVAKSKTEHANAAKTSAETDMLDLNFVEQETGKSHARDMTKQGAQARANMELKEKEAALKDRNTIIGSAAQNIFNPPSTGAQQ